MSSNSYPAVQIPITSWGLHITVRGRTWIIGVTRIPRDGDAKWVVELLAKKS